MAIWDTLAVPFVASTSILPETSIKLIVDQIVEKIHFLIKMFLEYQFGILYFLTW